MDGKVQVLIKSVVGFVLMVWWTAVVSSSALHETVDIGRQMILKQAVGMFHPSGRYPG